MKRPKICIVSLPAYPLLAKKDIEVVGGAELQSTLLARELRKRDFDVSFIVCDFGQQSPEIIDDIRILKAYPADAPMRIRFSTVRLIWRALRQADSDIYYGFRGIAGIVALYCLLRRKKLVIDIPSDMEVESERTNRISLYNWLWRFDLKRADCVITQTKYQQEMLKRSFGRNSVIIKAFHPVEGKLIEKSLPPIVLWVSTIRPEWKQPEIFLKLASAIPEARFQMAGGPSREEEFYQQIKAEAGKVPNLDFVGFVPHHEITKYFEKASIFVNTSDVEGFPNTFLEAWSTYTPVVSLNIDPDEIICERKLGFHSKSFEQMVEDVKLLLGDEELRNGLGQNGRRYVEQEHDLNSAVEHYIRLFNQLTDEDTHSPEMSRFPKERNKIIMSLIPYVGEAFEKKAIDVGCGDGVLTKMLWEKGYKSFGIDVDQEKIETARKRFGATELNFEIQDAAKLKFPDKSFDLVLCLELIEHLDDPEGLLIEIARVLKPGGTLVISTPNRFSLEGLAGRILARIRGRRWDAWDETHQRVFSSHEFLRLLNKKGFKPNRMVGYYYFPSIHHFRHLTYLNKLQEVFDFARYAHFAHPFLNKVGFDTICACVLKEHDTQASMRRKPRGNHG